jgi:O-antigen ligase
VRANLVSVALRLIGHHFWWGVGVGNFIPVAYREDLTGMMRSFPESVHNGWVLIMAEQGWWGMVFWLLFVGLLGYKWWKKYKNDFRYKWLIGGVFLSPVFGDDVSTVCQLY